MKPVSRFIWGVGLLVLLEFFGFSRGWAADNQAEIVRAQKPIDLLVVVPSSCRTCQVDPVVVSLEQILGPLNVKQVEDHSPEAKQLLADFKIEMLPAYILTKPVADVEKLGKLHQALTEMDRGFYVSPAISGVSVFANRIRHPGRRDLFLVLSDAKSLPLLKMVEGVVLNQQGGNSLGIHLVGALDAVSGRVAAPGGQREVEEGQLYACVEAIYPKEAWQYLNCRLANADSLFWDNCLAGGRRQAEKIATCARGNEGREFYLRKIRLAEELKIAYGPLFLLDNVEIFGVSPDSTLNDILKVLGSP